LPSEETPNVFGLDRGDVDGALAETSGQQPTDDAQRHAPRLRRQAPRVLHILVVSAQFLVYRCCAICGHRDDALSAQDHEQVS
jgi:hypothetical protein